MTGTSNGSTPDPRALVSTFDYAQWRKLTEAALAEGERRYAEAEGHLDAAREQLTARLAELDVLRRALALQPQTPGPKPLGPGTRLADGQGPGYRAAVYILEVLGQRYRTSGEVGFSTRVVTLACKGWPETTTHGGLRRLVTEGLVARAGRGRYVLTARGQEAPPAGPGTLPLLPPGATENSAETVGSGAGS